MAITGEHNPLFCCHLFTHTHSSGPVYPLPFSPVDVPLVMVTSPTLDTISPPSAPPATVDVALLTIERALFTLYTSQAASPPQPSPVKPSVADKPVVKLGAVPLSAKKKRGSFFPLAPVVALSSPSEATFGSINTLSSSPAFTDLSAFQDVPACAGAAVPTIMVTSPSIDELDVAPLPAPVDLAHLTIESARFAFYALQSAVAPQAPSPTQATEIKKDSFRFSAVPLSAKKKRASRLPASPVISPASPSEEPTSTFGTLTSSPTLADLADAFQDTAARDDTPAIVVTSASVEDLALTSALPVQVSFLTIERAIFTFHTLQAASPAPAPAPQPVVKAKATSTVCIGAVPLSSKRRRVPPPISVPTLQSVAAKQTARPDQQVPTILVTSPSVEDRPFVNRALLTEERAKWTFYVRRMLSQHLRGRTVTWMCMNALVTERRRPSGSGAQCAKPAVVGGRMCAVESN